MRNVVPNPQALGITMIKSIFFPVLAGEISESGLTAACHLAREHDAHVVAVICISAVTPVAAAWSYYPLAIYETLSEAAKTTSSKLYRELGDRLSKAGVSYETHVSDTLWMTTSEIAAVHARYCDITVFGRVAGADARVEGGLFADLLLQSGRPLLMVPANSTSRTSDCVVIAWKPTREATRAVHDALPLLRKSKLVQVIAVDPKVSDLEHGELPGADIGAHLAHHGLQVEVTACARLGASTGTAILRQAREHGAGLLIAGGYGHRRMREWVFGGVTRTLFYEADLPVLFSH